MDEPPPTERGGPQSVELLAHLKALLDERDLRHREELDRILERITAVDRLTDAKFVTFRTLIDSQAEKVALALASSDKAVTKAEAATEKRFESVNEFRSALADQTKLQVTVDKFDSVIEGLNGRIRSLEARIEKGEGQGQGAKDNKSGLYAAIGAVGVLVAIIVVVANMLAS